MRRRYLWLICVTGRQIGVDLLGAFTPIEALIARLECSRSAQDWLDDQLRAALTFGVSALDRYGHERVIKGIIPALKSSSLTRQQEEFNIPVFTAIQISEQAIAAPKNRENIRPTNIVREKVQELLHKRPFQSCREIEYAFALLGINNLAHQLQAAYRVAILSP